MKKKTVIAISWPLSILTAVWLGSVVGTKMGIEIGRSEASNTYTLSFSSDLSEIARSSADPTISGTLLGVQALIQKVMKPAEYEQQREDFETLLRELQNKGEVQPR